MLPLNERVRNKAHFQALYRNGKSYRGSTMRLLVVQVSETPSRAGFVVSKKVSKKAVTRNKIKRRMRFAYEQFSNVRQAHVFLLFTTYPNILKRSYSEIAFEMQTLLTKAGLDV
jgi:ribonuclease P protein component